MVLLKRKSAFTPRASFAFAKMAERMNWANLHPVALEAAPKD